MIAQLRGLIIYTGVGKAN